MKTYKRQLEFGIATRDMGSHIPTEKSKELPTESQKRRLTSESWGTPEFEAETKVELAGWAGEHRSQGMVNYQHINRKGLLKKNIMQDQDWEEATGFDLEKALSTFLRVVLVEQWVWKSD